MKAVFRVISSLSVAALAAVVATKASSQTADTERDSGPHWSDQIICRDALNPGNSGWDQDPKFSEYVAEAARRGLTVDACRLLFAKSPSPPTNSPPEPEITESGTREQGAFLEAALFFMTGVDASPTNEDFVSNRQINLGRYPIVAYLVDDNPCAIRIRTTTQPYTVWQMDFCKITHYQRSATRHYSITWLGYKTTFCIYRRWPKNTNYVGPINEQNSRCGLAPESAWPGKDNWWPVWMSDFDIHTLINNGSSAGRSVDRMIAAYKYIVTLLTGKPY